MSPRQEGTGPRRGGNTEAVPVARNRQSGATRGAGARRGPGGWSPAEWRQVISIALVAILALSGLGMVALSSNGIGSALVMGALVLALIVAVVILRWGH